MTSITYRLPRTQLVVSGVVTMSRDALKLVDEQPETTAALTSVEVKLVTAADLTTSLTLTPPTGMFVTYKGTFGVTPDGRLSTASSDTTGEVGTILKSLASLAGTAVKIAALGPGDAPVDDAKDERILAAYSGAHKDEHAAFVRLRKAREALNGQMAEEVGKVAAGSGDITELRRVRALMAIIDEQLVAADSHFRTWRSSFVESVEESFELRVAPIDIPKAVSGAGWGTGGTTTVGGPPKSLQELWERYGVGIEATWLADGTSATPRGQRQPTTIGTKSDHVYVRVPELLELRLVKSEGAEIVETGRQRAIVADDRSQILEFTLEKSRLGRKSLSLTFDADGFVSSVGVEGSSALAAGLSAATGAVEGFTGGVEGANKAFTAVRSAGRASLDAELARVKSEVELRQQRQLAVGLDATSSDAAELQRLQQLQGILEAQTKISGVDPAVVAELAKRAAGDLAWYRPPATPDPPEPQVIRILVGPEAPTAADPSPPPSLGEPQP